jgi:uncharacterized protein Yka (UPF0111/DUF47 family)
MLDTRAHFKDILNNVDKLLDTVDQRVAQVKLADRATVSSSVDAVNEAVAEVAALAKNAQAKLQEVEQNKLARRAEKVQTAQHIAKIANVLLSK